MGLTRKQLEREIKRLGSNQIIVVNSMDDIEFISPAEAGTKIHQAFARGGRVETFTDPRDDSDHYRIDDREYVIPASELKKHFPYGIRDDERTWSSSTVNINVDTSAMEEAMENMKERFEEMKAELDSKPKKFEHYLPCLMDVYCEVDGKKQ